MIVCIKSCLQKDYSVKHINTTATAINKIKSTAKKIKVDKNIKLAEALEIAAKQAGYESYHHTTTCAAKTSENKKNAMIGSLKIVLRKPERIAEFKVDDEEALYSITDDFDIVFDQIRGSFGDLTTLDYDELEHLILNCKALVKIEPAFLDGYAHWVGALVAQENFIEAIKVGEPVANAALDLIKVIPKSYKLNYYCLANRPFFRLIHNLVLALYGDNKNTKAKKLSEKMLELWPNDNVGFRFLLDPPPEDY